MKKLYPNCSESIMKLDIKKEEIPYIKRRLKDLGREDLLKNFTGMIGKTGEEGDMIGEGSSEPYNRIKEELLAKRKNTNLCPFCKEKITKSNHIKEMHKEETKNILKYIDKKEYAKLKREIIIDNI